MKVLGTLGTSKEWGLQQFFPHLLDVIIFFFLRNSLWDKSCKEHAFGEGQQSGYRGFTASQPGV